MKKKKENKKRKHRVERPYRYSERNRSPCSKRIEPVSRPTLCERSIKQPARSKDKQQLHPSRTWLCNEANDSFGVSEND